LEEVVDYKYCGIDFNKNIRWDGYRKKRTLGVGKHFILFKIGVERQSYGTGKLVKLFLRF